MTPEWPMLPLRRLGQIWLGKMLQSVSSSPTQIAAPYLRAAHVQPGGRLIDVETKSMWFEPTELAAHDLRGGDVVIVEGGAGFGRSAALRANRPGWGFQNSILRLRPRVGRADGRFIDYALQSAQRAGQIAAACNTATIPHFTADKVAALMVPAPGVATQAAIADYLDRETAEIDALIAKQQQLIGTLRERRKVIAESLLAERCPSTEGTRLKHHVRHVNQGWSPECFSWPTDGVHEWAVLKTGCVNWGTFRPYENKALPPDCEPRPSTVVQRGQVIMSRASTRELVGSAAVVEGDYPRLMLSDKLYAFTMKHGALPEYVSLVLNTRQTRDLIELEATGSSPSMQNVSQADLLNLPMNLPAADEQMEILHLVDSQTSSIDALISLAQQFVELSEERRAVIITAAVTGQSDVRTA